MDSGVTKEAVMQAVSQHGPIIPNDIKSHIGAGDTFIIGAVLSELKANGQIRVSNTKRGGSPFYFAPGQEPRLERVMQYLGEKDLRTAQRLKEEKVLRDKSLEPLTRVSLRQIKDFSRPLEVSVGGERVLFWKYYLVPNSDAEPIIRKLLGGAPKAVKQEERKPTPQPVREEKPLVAEKSIPQEPTPQPKKEESTEGFESIVDTYLRNKNITVKEKEAVRKASEWDYEVTIPSATGDLNYYCKAVKKKTINDKDLSSAYVEGEQRKLPVLFLTTGKLTKKAQAKLEKEFRNITVNHV